MEPLSGPTLLFVSLWVPVTTLALCAVIVLSCVVALGGSGRERLEPVKSRFLFGIPWGTLSIVVVLLFVYWFVQGGWVSPHTPTVIPFRSWSYFAPSGLALSSFSHSGQGHLMGNLAGALTVGVLAEYAWGHFPPEQAESGGVWPPTTPAARVLAFVGGSFVVGVASGLFSLGPTIGFSGVVFAYAGFALTRHPFGTLLALLWSRLLLLVYRSLMNPTITQGGHSQFVTPWWAGISVQGHVFGLFVGVVFGAVFLRRRSRPTGLRLWSSVLLLAVLEGLWAVYLPVDGGRFTLFRAVGIGAVFVLAALLTSAVRNSDARLPRLSVRYGETAQGLTIAILLVLGTVAVPYNFFMISEPTDGITPENSVTVGEYTITYAENIPHQYIKTVRVDGFSQPTNVTTSGVIVTSDEREIWWPEISKQRLAFAGRAGVRVGGVGWHETVIARRLTWNPVGNHSVYTVSLRHEQNSSLVYSSQPARAEPTVDGRRITIVPGEQFRVRISNNSSVLGDAPIPARNETTTVGGLTFNRTNNTLYATRNDTRVRVAKYKPP